MQESDAQVYTRFLRRVTGLILALGIAGAAVIAIWRGWRAGLSFLVGASVSYLSFWRWQRVADALTAQTPGKKQQRHWFFILRIVLLGALAWAIIKYLGLNFAAAASGLFISAAAVILELIYELIYAS